ncbi:glycosyltransferase family 2 protein [Vibrio diabolicus]|uniref:glycosyltransferase family 2 protein n=1 Tax=Vibrio diabolicus TaxID=50719 RepID=UPI00215F46B2|nr:glycosyltransferase family 2 protein [Vibrio diabolicus]MCS0378415.1 glycosyltransferase family 2 protein [Vibrio diabolicus]MCS0422188.1 glycosyltransferase family 2 protein [Vibrio diabolicus]
MKKFSILTATYNRDELLKQLYNSLLCQSYRDFEWVIVDDGSSDNTEVMVSAWREVGDLNIKYIKQKNKGKHRALNVGIKECQSQWTAIIDSDDYLTPIALSRASEIIDSESLDENENIAALIFTSIFKDGSVVGDEFPFYKYTGKTFEYYNKYNIKGDKFDYYKTDILKKHTFPEIKNEKFISEGIVWNRVNSKYDSLFINEGHQVVEYQTSGLSSNSVKARANNPFGSMLVYKESLYLNVGFKRKIRILINYYRFGFHAGGVYPIKSSLFLKLIVIPIAFLMYKKDIRL